MKLKFSNIILALIISAVFGFLTYLAGSATYAIASGLIADPTNEGLWVGTFAFSLLTAIMGLITVAMAGFELTHE